MADRKPKLARHGDSADPTFGSHRSFHGLRKKISEDRRTGAGDPLPLHVQGFSLRDRARLTRPDLRLAAPDAGHQACRGERLVLTRTQAILLIVLRTAARAAGQAHQGDEPGDNVTAAEPARHGQCITLAIAHFTMIALLPHFSNFARSTSDDGRMA